MGMQFPRIFKVGFVGALVCSPLVAETSDVVHSQAVEVLRRQIAAQSTLSVHDQASLELRRMNEHAASAAQNDPFPAFVQGRQDLRRAQREQDERIAREIGQVKPAWAAALEKQYAQAAEGTAKPKPQPSPYLQQRLKEIDAEVGQGSARVKTSAAPAAAPEAYSKELEERARQILRERSGLPPAPQAAAPGLDAKTREMLQRQTQEAAKSAAQPLGAASAPATPLPVIHAAPVAVSPLSAEAEAAARTILRQEAAAAPAAAPSSAPTAAPPAYSKELEDRARQILLERAQAQQAPAQPVPAPGVSAIVPAPIAPAPPAMAPAVAAPVIQPVVQAEGPKTKQQRLKELTDLYKADKIGPAEYHQKRREILAEPN